MIEKKKWLPVVAATRLREGKGGFKVARGLRDARERSHLAKEDTRRVQHESGKLELVISVGIQHVHVQGGDSCIVPQHAAANAALQRINHRTSPHCNALLATVFLYTQDYIVMEEEPYTMTQTDLMSPCESAMNEFGAAESQEAQDEMGENMTNIVDG